MVIVFIFFWWQEGGIKIGECDNMIIPSLPLILKISDEEYMVVYYNEGFRGEIYNVDGNCVRGCDGELITKPMCLHMEYGDWAYGNGVIYLLLRDNREGNIVESEIYLVAMDTLFNSLWGEEGIKLVDSSLSPMDPRILVGDDGIYVVWTERKGDNPTHVKVEKLNFNGDVEWSKVVDMEGMRDSSPNFVLLNNGDVVMGWETYAKSEKKIRLMRYRGDNGDEVWNSVLSFDGISIYKMGLPMVSDGEGAVIIMYSKLDSTGSREDGYCFQRIDGEGNKLWGDGVCISPMVFWDYSYFREGRMYVMYDIDRYDSYIEVNCLDRDGNLLFGDSGINVYVPSSGSENRINSFEPGWDYIYANGIFFFNTEPVSYRSPVYMMYNRLTESGLRWENSKDVGVENSWLWHGMEISDGVILAWEIDRDVYLGRIDTLGNWAGIGEDNRKEMKYNRVMFMKGDLKFRNVDKIEVYDVMGRRVRVYEGGDVILRYGDMADGVYFVRIYDNESERRIKLIKN